MTLRRPQRLRVLLVDDSEGEYLLVRNMLARFAGKSVWVDWVASAGEAARVFRETGAHDLYLIDYRLVDHTGFDAIKTLRDLGCKSPMIMLTTCIDSAIDREAMRAGAADYLIKAEMNRPLLHRAIRHVMERSSLNRALLESEERYRQLARNFPNGCLLLVDHEGRIQIAEGTAFPVLLGDQVQDGSQLVGRTLATTLPETLAQLFIQHVGKALGGRASTREFTHGQRQWLLSASPQQRFDAPAMATLVLKDLTGVRAVGTDLPQARLLSVLAELQRRGQLPQELSEAYAAVAQAPLEDQPAPAGGPVGA